MAVYYNEFDPFAAGWLRELIKGNTKHGLHLAGKEATMTNNKMTDEEANETMERCAFRVRETTMSVGRRDLSALLSAANHYKAAYEAEKRKHEALKHIFNQIMIEAGDVHDDWLLMLKEGTNHDKQ